MKEITKILQESTADLLKYGKENAVEAVIKTVFETIMNFEREEFLKSPEQRLAGNKGNGYYERAARGITKYFTMQIPRDRLSFFKSVFLESMKQKDAQIQELALKLYVKGLTTRDIENVLNESFSKKISAASVSNIVKKFEHSRKEWQARALDNEYYALYIDAIWISVRRENVKKEAFYIVMGLKKDLTREFLGVYNFPTESAQAWLECFDDLKNRGLKKSLIVVADGLKGVKDIIPRALPGASFQRCIVHKKRNILLHARSKDKPLINFELKEIFKVGDQNFTANDGLKLLKSFLGKWGKIYPSLRNKFPKDEMENLFAYLKFPHQVQSMIYTTNWLERANKTIRRSEKIRNSMPNEDSAMNLICACLMEQEEQFYLKYKITSFYPAVEFLENKLKEIGQTQFS